MENKFLKLPNPQQPFRLLIALFFFGSCLLLSPGTLFAAPPAAESTSKLPPAASSSSQAPRSSKEANREDVSPYDAASNYQLSGSDIILVKVFQEPDLDSQYRISKDGSITMPLIGTVNLGGKSISEAANLIRDRLADGYLRNPQVRVNVIQYAPRRFSVLGNVQKPGNYTMGEESTTDILEAIAIAGGFSKSADQTNLIVRRKAGGEEKVIEVNAKKLEKLQAKDSFKILPGDTIIVGERLF